VEGRHDGAWCNWSAARLRTKSGAIAKRHSLDDAEIATRVAPERRKSCDLA
jgi:hypothetical protein